MSVMTAEQALTELVHRHRELYNGSAIEAKLDRIIRDGRHTELTGWDVLRILRTSQSVFFDTHVEVVSGHHTATYLRFESIARFPQLIRLLARDLAGSTRKNRSKMRSWADSGMPMPWSLTLTSSEARAARALTTTRVCSGL